MLAAWYQYQIQARDFFRSLGMEAEVDVTVRGARTQHAVDVLVRSRQAGFDVKWIVECKHWNTPVSKLHVLALREIVTDAGADRGILLCEKGFQSGAVEAASLTNVRLTSLADLRVSTSEQIYAIRLIALRDRLQDCKDRYWNIDKDVRIQHGLRQDVSEAGFSGTHLISLLEETFARASRGNYPVEIGYQRMILPVQLPATAQSHEQVCTLFEPLIDDFERQLGAVDGLQPKIGSENH